jgi:hypothetical protein
MRWPPPARSSRRLALAVDRLEGRTLLAGDLLVAAQVPGYTIYHLMRFSQSGNLLESVQVPKGAGTTDSPQTRGIAVDPGGNIDVYNGTFTPVLSRYAPGTGTWLADQTLAGWSTVNNGSYGGVAAYGNYVFASDMSTGIGGGPRGIVRFDTSGGAPVRFATDGDFIKVTVGLDGLLYGLDGAYVSTVSVYDPGTLTKVRSVTLSHAPDLDIRGIAVDAAGDIFAATWGGYIVEFDTAGNLVASLQPGGSLSDIALDTDGQIVIGDRNGVIYLTDTALSPVRSFATGQWDAFVTFDHYINPFRVTPAFNSLNGATFTYGQSHATLGGRISGAAGVPTGSVAITLDGTTLAAPVDPATRTFFATFDTSSLGGAGSPYTVTYAYAGDLNYGPVRDTSQVVTVDRAVTSFAATTALTVGVSTPIATLSSQLRSNTVLPVGQAVTVSVLGASGPVVTGSAPVQADGSFAVVVATSSLPAGTYAVRYAYAGDGNFVGAETTGTLTVVSYLVKPLDDGTKAKRGTVAIKLQVTDVSGTNLSSPDLLVTAVQLVDTQGRTFTPKAQGKENPDNAFRYSSGSYSYNLDTTGLARGRCTLYVAIGKAPLLYPVTVVIG